MLVKHRGGGWTMVAAGATVECADACAASWQCSGSWGRERQHHAARLREQHASSHAERHAGGHTAHHVLLVREPSDARGRQGVCKRAGLWMYLWNCPTLMRCKHQCLMLAPRLYTRRMCMQVPRVLQPFMHGLDFMPFATPQAMKSVGRAAWKVARRM
jgi:hypothetical protein